MASFYERIRGSSIMQRAVRSSALTLINFGSAQFIRLISNLILTRLLFPEAFGIMALASATLVALNQFSDIGIIPSIIRSKRGEEPLFLDTAWTMKIMRGFALWGIAFAISLPMASFYDEPLLAQIIPFMAMTLILEGMLPTKIESALRHMQQGILTIIDLASNLLGVVSMIAMAIILDSLWALPVGMVLGSVGRLLLYHFLMPGRRNAFAFDRDAARELIQFGKWIFPATIATFIIIEADKFLIGRYTSMEVLGIYNIGFFLASFPLMLARTVGGRVMVSFFKNAEEFSTTEATQKARKLMFVAFGGLSLSVVPLVIIGEWLVEFLYDERYVAAGLILVTLTSMHMLQIAQIPYQNAVLGRGRGRDYFFLLAFKAVFMVACIWAGLELFGLLGAVLGQGLAMLLSYPVVIYYARKVNAFDPLFDLVMLALTAATVALAWWLHADQIQGLIVY